MKLMCQMGLTHTILYVIAFSKWDMSALQGLVFARWRGRLELWMLCLLPSLPSAELWWLSPEILAVAKLRRCADPTVFQIMIISQPCFYYV